MLITKYLHNRMTTKFIFFSIEGYRSDLVTRHLLKSARFQPPSFYSISRNEKLWLDTFCLILWVYLKKILDANGKNTILAKFAKHCKPILHVTTVNLSAGTVFPLCQKSSNEILASFTEVFTNLFKHTSIWLLLILFSQKLSCSKTLFISIQLHSPYKQVIKSNTLRKQSGGQLPRNVHRSPWGKWITGDWTCLQ